MFVLSVSVINGYCVNERIIMNKVLFDNHINELTTQIGLYLENSLTEELHFSMCDLSESDRKQQICFQLVQILLLYTKKFKKCLLAGKAKLKVASILIMRMNWLCTILHEIGHCIHLRSTGLSIDCFFRELYKKCDFDFQDPKYYCHYCPYVLKGRQCHFYCELYADDYALDAIKKIRSMLN